MTEFDELIEVVFYARDVERLTSFYEDAFGLTVESGDPEHGFVRFDTGACSLCLHAGGAEDAREDAPKVVFEVDDLDAARVHLREHGVALGEVRNPVPGVHVADGRDPEGNRFAVESSTAPE